MGAGRKKERLFRFKQFSVRHSESSMPVGVDGVLVGAWADTSGCREMLDIGTGCGVIALILAQHNPAAKVTAIDIDAPSVEEAELNFENSPWRESLRTLHISLDDFSTTDNSERFDLIVSNPPFFNSGVDSPESARLRARHEASLPLASLALHSSKLLREGGHLAVILPAEEIAGKFEEYCRHSGLILSRRTLVKGNSAKKVKRHLLEFVKGEEEPVIQTELTLEVAPGIPTEEYRSICSDLYLKF